MSGAPPFLLEDPWRVDAREAPPSVSPCDRLLFAVNYAVLAPSVLNAQPWRFRVRRDVLELHRRMTLRFPISDPNGREITISCGAALLNACVALRALGSAVRLKLLPAPRRPDCLAELRLGEDARPSPGDQRLLGAIVARRTHRGPFEERPLSPSLVEQMVAAAAEEGAALAVACDGSARTEVAGLAQEAERRHLADPAFRAEIARWLEERRSEGRRANREALWRLGASGHTPEPVRETTLHTSEAAGLSRRFADGERAAASQFAVVERSPALALIHTAADGAKDWLLAGMAMQRVLLTATAEGAAASFLNPPIEIAALRPRLAAAFGIAGQPQTLLRLGYAARRVPPTPRRPVCEVVEVVA